jgi:hypothetical protein
MNTEDLIDYYTSRGWDCKTSNTELSYIDFNMKKVMQIVFMIH